MWQRRYIKKQQNISPDSGQIREDLRGVGIYSALFLRVAWTNGATSNKVEDIIDAIDKIELIADGDKVLCSAAPIEVYKFNHFDYRRPVGRVWDQSGGATQAQTFVLQFGRYLGDREYYLDAGRYKSLDLRVDYSPTIAATAFASGGGVYDLYAYEWADGTPGPQAGLIRTKSYRDFTSAASGVESTDLTLGPVYKDILVYAYEAGIEDGVDITEVQLDRDNEATIFTRARWLDLQEDNETLLGVEGIDEVIAQVVNGDTIAFRQARLQEVSIQPHWAGVIGTDDSPHLAVNAVAGNQVTIQGYLIEGATTWVPNAALTTNTTARVKVRGQGVGHSVLITQPHPDNLGLNLDSSAFGKLTLRLTQGGAGAAVRIATREIVKA